MYKYPVPNCIENAILGVNHTSVPLRSKNPSPYIEPSAPPSIKMLPQFLLLAILPLTTSASPLNPTRSLEKRSNPNIASGYSAQHTTQIQDAFRNALELANYVQTIPDSTVDPIFKKYFNPGDKDKVMGKFLSPKTWSSNPLTS